MSRFFLSARARLDLLEIWNYIEQDNLDSAERLSDKLHAAMRKLADMPGMGPARPELGAELRSFPVGNYLIIYRRATNSINVARVIDGRRDIDTIFPESADD
jgi:toxin ParE1/3/4